MTRGYLVLGAAAVVVAAIGLYAALGTGAEDARDSGDPRRAAAEPSRPAAQNNAESNPGKPRLSPAEGSGSATEYYVGGTRVRDHRAGEHTPIQMSPAPPRRPERRDTASRLTADLAQRIRPAMGACIAGVPAELRGDKPRVEGEIIVAIKDHQATVTSAALALRDVPEAAQLGVRPCLARAAVGLVAPAGTEDDVDGYPITLSLSVP
jgi:hypothetical protein